MPRIATIALGLLLVASCGETEAHDMIEINGRPLTAEELEGFQQRFGTTPAPGNYWYDATSGMWGLTGEAPAGFLPPGLPFAPLGENASGGDSNVVVNGRRMAAGELVSWQWMLGAPIVPGRYWLDHMGNYGVEGFPMAAGNLLMLLAQRGGGGGAQGPWSTRFSAGNYDASSGAGYVSVPGHGPIGFGM